MEAKRKTIWLAAGIGAVFVILILALGGIWNGHSAKRDTEDAVRSVSLLYLDELAGRREQVVANNLKDRITDMEAALEIMTDEDLSDDEHRQAYQTKMKRLFSLERFAFADRDGTIYTSTGRMEGGDLYSFDYEAMTGPEIFIRNLDSTDKKVIIAMPVSIEFDGEELVVCFMEIDMDEMLSGVSMQGQGNGATFCNIYTSDGVALSNTVLGGLAIEDNLIEAMKNADYDEGYSYDAFVDDFHSKRRGEVSFTYNGISETLSYVPVEGTDWFLTYLIRESVISDEIGSVSDEIIRRSIMQSVLTVSVLLIVFALVIAQSQKNAKLRLEKEAADTENRVKQQELEHRLELQEKLLAEEQQRKQQESMISALASDYWSVYYLELEKGEGICYQSHGDIHDGLKAGERFQYLEAVKSYAERYVTDACREEFMRFIQPEAIQAALKEKNVISYTYTVLRNDRESYEMVRFAAVRKPGEGLDSPVTKVGACFTDVDAETRKALAQQQTLSDALAQAEQASRAKTAFLSNMSHEIRTPMNAIIGLDNIALADPEISDATRDYLEKIGTSAHHLLGIINDILDVSRIESGHMTIKNEEFSFAQMLAQINAVVSGQCRDKRIHYECRTIGKVEDYYIGDSMRLRQVIINILGNSVKFTPEGGSVTFLVEEVARYGGKSTLRFVMSDTGIGMSREFLPKLFEAFTQEDSSSTNRYGSTGLGMPITKSIVEMMNGDIRVDSEKGRGTTFTVTLTLLESRRKSGMEADEYEVQPEEMCVLVIDDDAIACEHAQIVLGQAGINCETATTGEEGLKMAELRYARREPYNLVLVDWKMPGMDGVETTRRIRASLGQEIPVIILTSYNWDDIAEEARAAGVDNFVAKPLFAGTVLETFREAFKKKNDSLTRRTADLAGRRILMAEDMVVNAEIMMMLLSMREITVELAENGRIAVDMFAGHEPGYYDAILMDMRMPEMDGLDATRAIRAMDREDAKTIPIIALTANAFDEDVQRSLQAGLNAHLSKPVEPEALFGTLENLIKD